MCSQAVIIVLTLADDLSPIRQMKEEEEKNKNKKQRMKERRRESETRSKVKKILWEARK